MRESSYTGFKFDYLASTPARKRISAYSQVAEVSDCRGSFPNSRRKSILDFGQRYGCGRVPAQNDETVLPERVIEVRVGPS